ncbi:cytosolic Cu/Zn superoxide dismutase [Verticillium alfalfae VaMs.102]|uniref:Cytosolic Cu/Zn superoxide dismutase n=1 Tax=Verticillium alfalfae (strain VaMs.102 / ATCC MYA-4576 / FGSC 10136) TaxID=526221 RepID=C9SHH6_VERA1|nr:cytosolic Cu/Zn superoxide dismutase [Verticillium alfalfae VaMs.102]EEY18399.1 cytosolic Cu/Zn superoxide dismutase [Verticillium alfalfae VaMs.102]
MRTQSVLSIIMAAAIGRVAAQEEPVTGELGDAPIVEGNPPGVVYEAVLPEDPFFAGVDIEGNVKGSITAISAPDGVGVEFKVTFSNLPKEGGPFAYHIHDSPATDGNCTSTRAHLDPYKRGQAIPCNPEAPETCEVGDLSGKARLRRVIRRPFRGPYVDPYSSLIEGQGSLLRQPAASSFTSAATSRASRAPTLSSRLEDSAAAPQARTWRQLHFQPRPRRPGAHGCRARADRKREPRSRAYCCRHHEHRPRWPSWLGCHGCRVWPVNVGLWGRKCG